MIRSGRNTCWSATFTLLTLEDGADPPHGESSRAQELPHGHLKEEGGYPAAEHRQEVRDEEGACKVERKKRLEGWRQERKQHGEEGRIRRMDVGEEATCEGRKD